MKAVTKIAGIVLHSSALILHPLLMQEVTRELLDAELVIRHVRIQRLHHPVAIRPDAARRVDAVAVAVRIARLIQPPAAPALAVMR